MSGDQSEQDGCGHDVEGIGWSPDRTACQGQQDRSATDESRCRSRSLLSVDVGKMLMDEAVATDGEEYARRTVDRWC